MSNLLDLKKYFLIINLWPKFCPYIFVLIFLSPLKKMLIMAGQKAFLNFAH